MYDKLDIYVKVAGRTQGKKCVKVHICAKMMDNQGRLMDRSGCVGAPIDMLRKYIEQPSNHAKYRLIPLTSKEKGFTEIFHKLLVSMLPIKHIPKYQP